MTVIVKEKTGVIVPPSIQRKAGFKPGDRLEFKVSGGVINIVPKRSAGDDDCTAEQRKAIDARLKEARKGPYYGPFDSAEELILHMGSELKKQTGVKTAKRRSR